MPLDLNALRDAVKRNQSKDDVLPDNPALQVVVDKDANVKMGADVKPGEAVTQVPQETFASWQEPATE